MLIYLSLIDGSSDQEKLIKFYNEYRFTMLHVACSVLHDQSLAEDAVHEAFIRIAKNIKRIKDNGHQTRAFLVTIVRNVSIDMIKNYNHNLLVSLDDDEKALDIPDAMNVQQMVIEKIEVNAIIEIVNRLPIIYSSVFLLKYHHDYENRDISLLLNISEATVRKRLQRAKEMLAKLISKKGDEESV